MFRSAWQKRQVRPAILESPLQCRMNSIAPKFAEKYSMIQFVLGNWKCIWQKQSSFMRLPIESILNSILSMAPFLGKTPHQNVGSVRLFMFCIPDISVPKIVNYQALMSTKKIRDIGGIQKTFYGLSVLL